MRPTAAQLTMRDPALAAVMGALPSTDYGYDAGADTGADFGMDAGFGFGIDPDFEEALDSLTIGIAPPAPPILHRPAPPHMQHAQHGLTAAQQAALARHHMVESHTHARDLMLNPNKYSTVKVEGYSFPINPTSGAFTLGTSIGFNGTIQPNARIRPTVAITNVAWPGFVTLSTIQVANVNAIIGGTDDASSYSFLAMGKHIKLPPLDMSTRGSMSGAYTGFVPPGYTMGGSFLFALTLQGPSALAGNG